MLGLETYSEFLDALHLRSAGDAEAAAIQARLARARPQVHLCAGVPALVVDDIDGLVELLRRRAAGPGVALKLNPEGWSRPLAASTPGVGGHGHSGRLEVCAPQDNRGLRP